MEITKENVCKVSSVKDELNTLRTKNIADDITGENIENVIITAIEWGIEHWATVDNTTKVFQSIEHLNLPLSEEIFYIIMNGGEVKISDLYKEEPEKHMLSLTTILSGIRKNMKERPQDADLEDFDSITADCIFQYAIFDDLIFS